MQLLTKPGGNPKLSKGLQDYLAFILHLAPAKMGQRENVCKNASPECIALCLNYSGHAMISGPKNPKRNMILAARVRKTQFLFDNPIAFEARLTREIQNAIKYAHKRGKIPCFRLNGTSDLDWTAIVNKFSAYQFYDYTKVPERMNRYLLGLLPSNYHLTFSFSGRNEELCKSFLSRGGSVAVAFARPVGTPYVRPLAWHGYVTIDGDATDLRFTDTPGTVVALKAKGIARTYKANRFVVGS
jgi:hypothetical protein